MEGRAGRREIGRSLGGPVWSLRKTPNQLVLTSGTLISQRPARGGFMAAREWICRRDPPFGPGTRVDLLSLTHRYAPYERGPSQPSAVGFPPAPHSWPPAFGVRPPST